MSFRNISNMIDGLLEAIAPEQLMTKLFTHQPNPTPQMEQLQKLMPSSGVGAAECDECGHAIRLHGDKYGCQYERGDHPGGEGPRGPYGAYAMGPCGCMCEFCENCGSPNHSADDCEDRRVCTNCGAWDHQLRHCPEPDRRTQEPHDTPEANR